jgi:ATP-dependent helicase HrpA
MAAAYMGLGGSIDELRAQIVEVALDRAFLGEPLPTDERGFRARIDEGRSRLVLIAHEVARQAAAVLAEYLVAARKLKDSRPPKDVADDVQAQLQRLLPKRFVATTAWAALQHFPRYLKAITLRLEKLRADPARDARFAAEFNPLWQTWQREDAKQRKQGVADPQLDQLRWLLEELRVSLYAQELRTPVPVSVKRLQKMWQSMQR